MSFVHNGNQSVFNATAFKKVLLGKGVAANEFYENAHVHMFNEVGSHLMSYYLAQRPKLLHKEALAAAKNEYESELATPIPAPYASAV
ncbi:MAG: hypothetical protein RLZZ76_70 [Candidatus Parcubacteria bacterium]|jgi:hypothetical protein